MIHVFGICQSNKSPVSAGDGREPRHNSALDLDLSLAHALALVLVLGLGLGLGLDLDRASPNQRPIRWRRPATGKLCCVQIARPDGNKWPARLGQPSLWATGHCIM